jgi:hypothetical protein
MTRFVQIAAVIAISFGAGSYAFSRHLDLPLNLASLVSAINAGSPDAQVAAIACGCGIGFSTLGLLGLAVPWLNIYMRSAGAVVSATS